MIRYPNRKEWSCGEGWNLLIETFLMRLNALCEDQEVEITCIKEKFGSLSIYVEGGVYEEIWPLVQEYEQESTCICEHCGMLGGYRGELDWKQTLCQKCFRKVLKKQRKDWGFHEWKNHIMKYVEHTLRRWASQLRKWRDKE